jgi:hypothetical protein
MCTELRSIAARTRSGEAKIIFRAPDNPQVPYLWQVERYATLALRVAGPSAGPGVDDVAAEAASTTAAGADPVAEYEPFEHEPFPLAEPPPPSNEDFSTIDSETARAA